MNLSYKNKNNAYIDFNREQWSKLANNVNFNLTDNDIAPLLGFNESLSIEELNDYYSPLVRLLKYYIDGYHSNYRITQKFLNHRTNPPPFIIGITGSVSVGKSTFTRILKHILEIYFADSTVSMINTDGFLYPLSYLTEQNLLDRKGFPESYDTNSLLEFLSNVRSGKVAKAPIYSHISYNIVENEYIEVAHPDILLVEGLNILQTGDTSSTSYNMFISDFIDFSIYVDARTPILKDWYIKRFLNFKNSTFKDNNSYFKKFTTLTDEQAVATACEIWRTINEVNLKQHILPSRERADLIIVKDLDHKIHKVRLRK